MGLSYCVTLTSKVSITWLYMKQLSLQYEEYLILSALCGR